MNVVPGSNQLPAVNVSTDDLLTSLQDVYGRGLATAMGEQARFKAGFVAAQTMLATLQATVDTLQAQLSEKDNEAASFRASLDQALAANASLQSANERLADENDKLRDDVREALPEGMKED